MWLFRKRNNEKIQRRVLKKEQATRSILLVVGCFISALSFNLFLYLIILYQADLVV